MPASLPRLLLLLFLGLLAPLRAQEAAKISTPVTSIQEGAELPADPLLIGSWNIRWFPRGGPTKEVTEKDIRDTIEDTAKFIRKENPTIVFACEVRDIDALKAMKLPYPYIACTEIPRTQEENPSYPLQSLSFLSKIPWKETWVIDFSGLAETADRPSRGILGAEFDAPGVGKLTLYGVHLKSNRGGVEAARLRRQRAVAYLAEDFKRRGLDPKKDQILIMGDFNTSARDPGFASDLTLKMLKELGFVSASEGLPLAKAASIKAEGKYAANDFDHMLVSEGLRDKIKAPLPWMEMVAVPDSLSDHNPIFLPLGKLLAPAAP